MDETKQRIKKVVGDYITLFPEEYALSQEEIKSRRGLVEDDFASTEMFDGRVLYEIPETLSKMLGSQLFEQDLVWLKSGGLNKKQGARWFANTFRQFTLADKL